MFVLTVGDKEFYDSKKNEFGIIEGLSVKLEYSLKAIYDWESRHKKSFIKGEMTDLEFLDFIKCMVLDEQELDLSLITSKEVMDVKKYLEDKQTATVFSSLGQNGNKVAKPKAQTAEEIYAIMILNNIPLEWENRNFNRLLTLIRIIAHKQEPPKKMNREDVIRQNAELNRQRKAQLNTRG